MPGIGLFLVAAGPVRAAAVKAVAHVLGTFFRILGYLFQGTASISDDRLTLELDNIPIPVAAVGAFRRIGLFDRYDLVTGFG